MYKKYLVIASREDKAGLNIATALSQFPSPLFDIELINGETIYTESLNIAKINLYDFIIFASRHESEKKQKTISIHAPGNWRKAEFGGISEKIGKTSAQFQKQLFQALSKTMKEANVSNYELTLECTHHGPLIEKPSIFLEIGSTSVEWGDRRTIFLIAKTLSDFLPKFKPNPYNENAIGIGGPHYCPGFNKIQLTSNVAISHIIPQYVFPVSDEMIKEAVSKTQEDIDFAIIDWKGVGTAEQRDMLLELLDKNYIRYKKINEIKY